jgi:hypothetical protein
MRKIYLIDHRLLFLFGYIFYLFTPYFLGTGRIFEGYPGIDLYQSYFQLLPANRLQTYLLVTLSWLPAFFLGHYFYELFFARPASLLKYPTSPVSQSMWVVSILLFLLLIVFTYLARNSILGNYANYDVGARGKMSTLLIIFNFFMMYLLIGEKAKPILIMSGTVITAAILLFMGGRMYVFQTFIIMLVYKTSFSSQRWTVPKIILFSGLGMLVGSAFGLWRMGSALGFESASYSFFAEPAFTWFSTITFLSNNEIPLFNWPANFLSSFVNLVPNTLVSLRPYLVSLESMAAGYKNPLGADSVWSTIVINFGSIGSVIFIFITGFFLNFLRDNSYRSRFGAVYYIMVCGMLPFQFFRDGFFILNKQLFFNFLIFPASILFSLKLMIYLQKKWMAVNNLGNAPVTR